MSASNTEVRCAHFTRRGNLGKQRLVGLQYGRSSTPPTSSKPILEFSLGGLEDWNLALHSWEEGLGGRRELYKNKVLGAST